MRAKVVGKRRSMARVADVAQVHDGVVEDTRLARAVDLHPGVEAQRMADDDVVADDAVVVVDAHAAVGRVRIAARRLARHRVAEADAARALLDDVVFDQRVSGAEENSKLKGEVWHSAGSTGGATPAQ